MSINILICFYFTGINKVFAENYTTSHRQYPKLPPTDFTPSPYKVKNKLIIYV